MIVEKQTLDAFSNPNFSGILQQCPTQPSDAEYVVFGVATDYCVRCAVDGLLNAGKQVRVLTDAIRAIDAVQSEKLLASWAARGAALTTTDTLWR